MPAFPHAMIFISVDPNEEKEIFGMKVRTLRSNDQGVAYLVRSGNRTIYHAGDLNWWHWEEESEVFNKMIRRTYQAEINKLQGEKIDIAFVPVDPRLGEQYCWGLDCFMKRTDVKHVFPMHFWGIMIFSTGLCWRNARKAIGTEL